MDNVLNKGGKLFSHSVFIGDFGMNFTGGWPMSSDYFI